MALEPVEFELKRQRGAALLIVLLLVAALSFIALSITDRTALAATRLVNERARAENIWSAFGVETLARAAIETAAARGVMSIDDAWLSEPLEVPTDEGGARLFFADATRCLNVNALGGPEERAEEFATLVRLLGLGQFEGDRIAHVIIDWIDQDSSRQPQGAEDGYYTTLPSPYRTGGGAVYDISELRAMAGISRELYASLKPYLCAHPAPTASTINFNMVQVQHAPILAAAIGNGLTIADAESIIVSRPVGGWADLAEFQASSSVAALSAPQLAAITSARFSEKSNYINVRAEIIYDTSFLEMTVKFGLNGAEARVLARRFGASE